MKMRLQIIFVTCLGFSCFILSVFGITRSNTTHKHEHLRISNLNGDCIRCLCHVAGCDMNRGCMEGYCGPFIISRLYWIDAGKPTLPDDDPDRQEAFQDCAGNYHCSIRIVEAYMAKFGKDCNNDGVTDCFDYMMINNNGPVCSKSLTLTEGGRRRLSAYQLCQF